MPINPYRTHEPFVWAGAFLLFRGRAIGCIDFLSDVAPPQPQWQSMRLMGVYGEPLRREPIEISRGLYQSVVMHDLEHWLAGMIGNHADLLDQFAPPLPLAFKIGDRVMITRENFGHPDLVSLTGAVGTVTQDEEPVSWDLSNERRYEVTFDTPMGERQYLDHFPLYMADLKPV